LSARLAIGLVASAALVIGCAELIGIRDIGDAGDSGSTPDVVADVLPDAPPPSTLCTNAVTVLSASSASPLDLGVQGGFAYAVAAEGIWRCAVTGSCVEPLLTIEGQAPAFQDGVIGPSSLAYTIQTVAASGVHTSALDGTGDKVLLPTANAGFVALGLNQVYWLDDSTEDVHCIGCMGPGVDATWITGRSAPIALFADANSVYVVDYDSSTTLAIYGCSASAACDTSPSTVLGGLAGPSKPMLASDDSFVYVARTEASDVVRVSSTTQAKVIMSGPVVALAVDKASGDLFYATAGGELGRTKSDGSQSPVPLSLCSSAPSAVAFDATRVYALVFDGSKLDVIAAPR
jgi:hypothetical protein